MSRFHEVSALIRKDLRIELRQRSAINGVILYLVSTLFICYLSFSANADPQSLISLFWVVILFAATNAVSKSFVQENSYRQATYNLLASQASLILAKLLYNALLMLLISSLCFFLFAFLLGNPVQNMAAFIPVLGLGSIGFSSLMTFVSAIASRTGNHFAMTAVLGFPIALPLIVLCVSLTTACMGTELPAGFWSKIAVLLLLDGIIAALAYILFPFLWRE